MSIDSVVKKMDFIKGKYLDSSALTFEGVEVTIKAIKTESVKNMTTFKNTDEWIAYFEEMEWGWLLSAKCNRKGILKKVNGDKTKLKGLKLKIYNEPTVKFQGKEVGGIRIK